jgi:hypothetical protein
LLNNCVCMCYALARRKGAHKEIHKQTHSSPHEIKLHVLKA